MCRGGGAVSLHPHTLYCSTKTRPKPKIYGQHKLDLMGFLKKEGIKLGGWKEGLDVGGVGGDSEHSQNSLFAILKYIRITSFRFNSSFIPFMVSQDTKSILHPKFVLKLPSTLLK